MMSAPQSAITILTSATDEYNARNYLIKPISTRWEKMGFNILLATDSEPVAPTEIGLLHVDASVVPNSCRNLAQRYAKVLNGRVVDIRKRTFSRMLVGRDGPDPGAVIVKTDWNCGGRMDFRRRVLESPVGTILRRVRLEEAYYCMSAWLEVRRPWPRRRWLSPGAYRIFPSRDLVPAHVWSNANLIVERFVAEREGPHYCCRHWLFLGDCEVGRRTLSLSPVVKADAKLEPLSEPVPKELRAIRKRLGFNYGKFDYGIVNGEVVLYDINPTPGITSDWRRHVETIEALSPGIYSAIEKISFPD